MTSTSDRPYLAIWGASGHAMVVADIVRLQGAYRIAGFLDDINPNRHGSEFCGATVLGGREQLERLLDEKVRHMLLGFGNCRMRLELTRMLVDQGFSLPVAIHPRAVVAEDVALGQGTVIAAGAVINPGTRIGNSVIINTSASVDHECTIGEAAHICPGAHIAGRVEVGQAVWIGIGAIVIDGVRIGAGSYVGAGSLVISNIPDGVVAYGVPASVKRRVDQ